MFSLVRGEEGFKSWIGVETGEGSFSENRMKLDRFGGNFEGIRAMRPTNIPPAKLSTA
jgi:hypothetical protein